MKSRNYLRAVVACKDHRVSKSEKTVSVNIDENCLRQIIMHDTLENKSRCFRTPVAFSAVEWRDNNLKPLDGVQDQWMEIWGDEVIAVASLGNNELLYALPISLKTMCVDLGDSASVEA